MATRRGGLGAGALMGRVIVAPLASRCRLALGDHHHRMANILIVDDDPSTALVTRAALEVDGHSVVVVDDPRVAVERAARAHVECIVLDVVMPGLSGFALISDLRARPETQDVPVLFLSALSAPANRVHGLRLGAADYLTKPFEPEELALRVGRMIAARARSTTAPLQRADGLYLGRYRLDKELGSGATGSVFRAWDTKLERPVALKRVRLEGAADDARSSRPPLLHEAISTAQLNHPHIVGIYDFDDTPPSAFIAMELVDGVTLAEHLDVEGRLPPERVLPLAIALAGALEAAHGRRLLHHDVKPANVLLGFDGAIKIADFGLACVATAIAAAPFAVYGTPGYLPPEAIMGAGQRESGDLFALGALLYRCLDGQQPFGGESLVRVLTRTLHEQPPPLDLAPEWSELGALVMELLAKVPEQRPATAAGVKERLLAIARGRTIGWVAPRRSSVPAPAPARRRSQLLTEAELAPLRQGGEGP